MALLAGSVVVRWHPAILRLAQILLTAEVEAAAGLTALRRRFVMGPLGALLEPAEVEVA